jgi:hypothetical protein
MRTLPQPGDVLYQVADQLARVATLREALDVGHYDYAVSIAERLELDLVALRERLQRDRAA